MDDDYIAISKAKLKSFFKNLLVIVITSLCIVWVFCAKTFLGFGYHNFADQFFRLFLGIIIPMIIMTVTDYYITNLFNNKKTTRFIILLEAMLICMKNCYSSLCASDGKLLGVSEPNTVIILSVIFHLSFWLLLFFLQAFILHKFVLRAITKHNENNNC